jgi:hypothetical protein
LTSIAEAVLVNRRYQFFSEGFVPGFFLWFGVEVSAFAPGFGGQVF